MSLHNNSCVVRKASKTRLISDHSHYPRLVLEEERMTNISASMANPPFSATSCPQTDLARPSLCICIDCIALTAKVVRLSIKEDIAKAAPSDRRHHRCPPSTPSRTPCLLQRSYEYLNSYRYTTLLTFFVGISTIKGIASVAVFLCVPAR